MKVGFFEVVERETEIMDKRAVTTGVMNFKHNILPSKKKIVQIKWVPERERSDV